MNKFTSQTVSNYHALIAGIQRFFKDKAPKACLGLSGGLDSALVLALVHQALGPQAEIKVLLMPSQYSSQHSIDDALAMVKILNIQHEIVPIAPLYSAFISSLAPVFGTTDVDVTEENLQARIRGVLLMALSNKQGYYVLNTSNKSELAVGYGTLYGDLCGAISVIGDLYKTDAFELAKYLNKDTEIIPLNIINKPPSAELRSNQYDTDSLPEYPILDTILRLIIDEQRSCNEVITSGFDADLVRKIFNLRNKALFKAMQLPPIIKLAPWSVVPEWKSY